MTAVVLAACHRSTADQTAYMRGFTAPKQEAPIGLPTPAQTYVALDYGKPGEPSLTVKEIAQIETVLREVKPCQRALLRYAFPSNASSGKPMVVIFQIVELPNGYSGSHVFGASNQMYIFNGEVHPTMDTMSDEFAIKHEKCGVAR